MKRKLLSVLLVLAMALTLLPTAAFATDMDLDGADVKEITSVATIDKTTISDVKVSVNPANALEWVAQDATIGRGYDGWWIGFKAIAPSSVTADNLTSVKYRNNGSLEDKTTFETSNDGKDGDNYYIQLWGGISESILEQFVAAKKDTIQYVWYFNWDGNDNTGKTITADNFKSTSGTATDMTGVDQVITLTFNLNDVTLKNQNGTQAWPQKAEGYETVGIANPNLTIYPDYANGANGPWDDEASATATAVTGELNKYNVAVTAKNLVEHKREGDATTGTNAGNWIGFTVPYDETDTYKQGWNSELGNSFNAPDGIDGNKAGFYWNLTEAHKNAKDKGILEVTHGITKITYIVDFTNVTLYKAVTPTLTFGEANPDAECFIGADSTTKKVSDMGKFTFEVDKDDSNKIIVTGTATYRVQTGFNTAHQNEEKGHYLPIKITSNTDREITIINCSDGAKNGKTHTLTADAGYETLVWLDGKTSEYTGTSAANLESNTFKVDDYVIDFSGVALLPQVVADKSVEGATTATVPTEEADKMVDLIGSATVRDDGTAANTPVSVEVTTSGDKTLVFDATADDGVEATTNKGHTVTLPSALVNTMGDQTSTNESKADVKVNSGVGSVTVPSVALPSTGSDSVTVGIKEATATSTTLAGKTIEGVSDETVKTTISDVVSGKTGVDVTATKGANTPLIGESNTSVLEIVIKVPANKTYTVLCVGDSKVTSFGEKTPTLKDGKYFITIRSTHLSEWYPIDNSFLTSDQKTALNAITKETEPTPPTPSAIDFTITAPTNGLCTVNVTGAIANAPFTVQVARGTAANLQAPAVIFTMDAEADSTASFKVNANSVVTVWQTVTINGAIPTAPTAGVTKVAPNA